MEGITLQLTFLKLKALLAAFLLSLLRNQLVFVLDVVSLRETGTPWANLTPHISCLFDVIHVVTLCVLCDGQLGRTVLMVATADLLFWELLSHISHGVLVSLLDALASKYLIKKLLEESGSALGIVTGIGVDQQDIADSCAILELWEVVVGVAGM